KAHAVRMSRQTLVIHEEQLHRLVERDLMRSEQVDSSAAADSLQGRLDAVRIDRLGQSTFQTDQHGTVGAVAGAGERKRAVQPHGDLVRRPEQRITLQREYELARRAHRTHGVRAGRADAYLENVEYAQCHIVIDAALNRGRAGGATRGARVCQDAPPDAASAQPPLSSGRRTPRGALGSW